MPNDKPIYKFDVFAISSSFMEECNKQIKQGYKLHSWHYIRRPDLARIAAVFELIDKRFEEL